MAAEAAPHLCDEFAIKPTTTKNGAFCALAAVMWGDETADLQKHVSRCLRPATAHCSQNEAPNRDKNSSCSALKTWVVRLGRDANEAHR